MALIDAISVNAAISLRNFFVVQILLLFILAAGLIGWVGYQSSQNAFEQFERS